MTSRIRTGAILSLAVLVFTAVQAFSQGAPLEGFHDYAEKARKEWKVPGMAIAVVKDDKIVFARGYGVRELGKSAPVTENTLFAIGSSSKAFTAAALAILADEGKVKWDDKATDHLKGFQLFDPYVTREMTVRDLLSHRIGLERGDLMWYGSDYSRDEILHRIRFLEPSSSVRTRFGYQNIMYLAAGQMVPVLTGKTWDKFVTERIFGPLGMKSSGTSISELASFSDVATPHAEIDDEVRTVAWRKIDNIAPAGSINSNVTDMAQWVRLQLGNGKFGDKQLISAKEIKEMQTSQSIIRLEGQMALLYPEAHFLNYGLGWFLSDFRGKKMVEHGGAIDGMRALVAMIPEEKVGVVILTNMNGTVLPQYLAYRVFDAYLGAAEKDWAGDGLKVINSIMARAKEAAAKAEAERVEGTSPSLEAAKYSGKYTNEMYGDATVTFENGKLSARYGPAFNGDLEHWNYDTFRVTWSDPIQGKGFVTFTLDRKGNVAKMAIQGIAEFDRVPEKPKADGR